MVSQMNNNFWGDSDDEPLPDWMNPNTYRNPKPKRFGPSLDDEIMKALAKPPVPIILQEPKVDE